MLHHSRLLRRVLLISTLVTLAGLHVPGQRSPDGWRAARLLPLAFGAVSLLANLAAAASSGSAQSGLMSVMFGVLSVHTLLVLVHLLRRRRQLHAILERSAAVESATAFCRQSDDFARVRWKTAIVFVITVSAVALWITSFLTGEQELKHPNYLFPVLLPEVLQKQSFYWTIVGLEMVACVIAFSLQCLFDILLIGLMDQVAVSQMRLTRFIK